MSRVAPSPSDDEIEEPPDLFKGMSMGDSAGGKTPSLEEEKLEEDERPAAAPRRKRTKLRGVPVKALRAMYATKQVTRNYLQLFFYLLFVCLYIYLNIDYRDITGKMYDQVESLQDVFTRETFEEGVDVRDFWTIGSAEDVWAWVKEPYIKNIYATPNLTVYMYNRVIGQIAIRQLRVTNTTEVIGGQMSLVFPPYRPANEARIPDPFYGEYRSDLGPLYGRRGRSNLRYGTGGYVLYLPREQSAARAMIGALEAGNYINEGTRCVSVDANFFNPNLRQVVATRFLLEQTPGGRFEVSALFQAMPIALFEFSKSSDVLRVVMTILFVVLLLAYIISEVLEMYYEKWDYLCNKNKMQVAWNVIEIMNLGLYIVVIAMLSSVYFVRWVGGEFDSQGRLLAFDQYRDIYTIADAYTDTAVLSAINVVVSTLKVFKYLQLNESLILIVLALFRSLPPLLMYLFVILFLLLGFSIAGHLVFGSHLEEFRSIFMSVQGLTKLMLGGEFDYESIELIMPTFGPIFYSVVVAVLVVLCLNFIIAIVVYAFESTKTKYHADQALMKSIPQSLRLDIFGRAARFFHVAFLNWKLGRTKKQGSLRFIFGGGHTDAKSLREHRRRSSELVVSKIKQNEVVKRKEEESYVNLVKKTTPLEKGIWSNFRITARGKYGKLFTRKDHLTKEEQEMKLEAHQIAEMLGDIEAAESLVKDYNEVGVLERRYLQQKARLGGHWLEGFGDDDDISVAECLQDLRDEQEETTSKLDRLTDLIEALSDDRRAQAAAPAHEGGTASSKVDASRPAASLGGLGVPKSSQPSDGVMSPGTVMDLRTSWAETGDGVRGAKPSPRDRPSGT